MDFRDATESDLPYIAALAQAFFPRYAADGQQPPTLQDFAGDWLEEAYPIVFTITNPSKTDDGWVREENQVGFAWFDGFNADLSGHLHLIILPAHLRTFLREYVYQDALEDRFRVTGVRKFLVLCPDFNESQKKLLQRCGFTWEATLRQEIYYKGEVRDVHYWSITRKELAKALRKRFIEQELPEEKLKPEPVPKKKKKASNNESSILVIKQDSGSPPA